MTSTMNLGVAASGAPTPPAKPGRKKKAILLEGGPLTDEEKVLLEKRLAYARSHLVAREPSVIGFRHRRKLMVGKKIQGTMIALVPVDDQGRPRKDRPVLRRELTEDMSELDFVFGVMPDSYRDATEEDGDLSQFFPRHIRRPKEGAKKQVIRVPAAFDGLRETDRAVSMSLGGSGDALAVATMTYVTAPNRNWSIPIMRIPPADLKRERELRLAASGKKIEIAEDPERTDRDKDILVESAQKANDDELLAMLLIERPELFKPMTAVHLEVLSIKVVYLLFDETRKARIAAGQRIVQATLADVFLRAGLMEQPPELSAVQEARLASDTGYQALRAHETYLEKELQKLLDRSLIYREVFEQVEGAGTRIIGQLIAAVDAGPFRRDPNTPEVIELSKQRDALLASINFDELRLDPGFRGRTMESPEALAAGLRWFQARPELAEQTVHMERAVAIGADISAWYTANKGVDTSARDLGQLNEMRESLVAALNDAESWSCWDAVDAELASNRNHNFNRLKSGVEWLTAQGRADEAEKLGEALRLYCEIGRLRRKQFNKGLSGFRKYCGVGMETRDSNGKELPQSEWYFPRRRRGAVMRCKPEARQGFYKFACQVVRDASSPWGFRFLDIKLRVRQAHPTAVKMEATATRKARMAYTDGHVHKMAIWKLAADFAKWVYEAWLKVLDGKPVPAQPRRPTADEVKEIRAKLKSLKLSKGNDEGEGDDTGEAGSPDSDGDSENDSLADAGK